MQLASQSSSRLCSWWWFIQGLPQHCTNSISVTIIPNLTIWNSHCPTLHVDYCIPNCSWFSGWLHWNWCFSFFRWCVVCAPWPVCGLKPVTDKHKSKGLDLWQNLDHICVLPLSKGGAKRLLEGWQIKCFSQILQKFFFFFFCNAGERSHDESKWIFGQKIYLTQFPIIRMRDKVWSGKRMSINVK